jgi:hypothetical protein
VRGGYAFFGGLKRLVLEFGFSVKPKFKDQISISKEGGTPPNLPLEKGRDPK